MPRVTSHQVDSKSSARQELLYDPEVATPTHAERSRTLVTQRSVATLCTLRDGHPYGSLVTYALADDKPVFLVSLLAEHTRNLQQDPRASLLVAEDGRTDPLANARVTLVGRCEPLARGEDGKARAAFLAAHPQSAYYVDFKDFAFWQLQVDSLRYIGGYGRMSWVERGAWTDADSDPLAPGAAQIVTHMNEDHGEAMVAYCHAFTRATDTTAAVMTGIDRYGFEMSATTAAGQRPIRLAFAQPIATAGEARSELVRLVQEARKQLATSAS